jgi:hypothetical protein
MELVGYIAAVLIGISLSLIGDTNHTKIQTMQATSN